MVLETRDVGVARSDPERELTTRLARDRVATALARLPEERRTTLVLRLIFGHSIAEIAELTGVPSNTVRGRIRTGLKELRGSPEARRALRLVK